MIVIADTSPLNYLVLIGVDCEGAQRMPLCHRHQLQYLSAHVVGESPKCRGSMRDGASDDSQ